MLRLTTGCDILRNSDAFDCDLSQTVQSRHESSSIDTAIGHRRVINIWLDLDGVINMILHLNESRLQVVDQLRIYSKLEYLNFFCRIWIQLIYSILP
jgi:hypothetical protein